MGGDDSKVEHRVEVSTLPAWLLEQLGVDATAGVALTEWLLMPQQHLAPFRGAAFDIQHLVQLQSLQSWVRQIKWNRETRDAIGREPFLGKPHVRAKVERSGRELAIKPFEP